MDDWTGREVAVWMTVHVEVSRWLTSHTLCICVMIYASMYPLYY